MTEQDNTEIAADMALHIVRMLDQRIDRLEARIKALRDEFEAFIKECAYDAENDASVQTRL